MRASKIEQEQEAQVQQVGASDEYKLKIDRY
jgi:hypothetical protein